MRITLHSPSDFHTHLRGYNGDPTDALAEKPNAIFQAVSALQSPFAQVLAMPNLVPNHIQTADEVDAYRIELERYLPA